MLRTPLEWRSVMSMDRRLLVNDFLAPRQFVDAEDTA